MADVQCRTLLRCPRLARGCVGRTGDNTVNSRRNRDILRPTVAGAVGVVGGLLWLGALLAEYRFNLFLPGPGTAYIVDQLVFIAAMFCYITALLGLRQSGAAGRGRGAKTVVAIWAAGWILVALGAITSIVAPDFKPAAVLPAVGGLLTCIFGLITGVLVARRDEWRGWPRWVPLAISSYVLLVLFLPLFLGAEPSLLTEAGWALGYVLLGAALLAAESRRSQQPGKTGLAQP
jgi:hypothetical protein